MTSKTWIVGQGLLGSAVASELVQRGRTLWFPSRQFNWNQDLALDLAIENSCNEFAAAVGASAWSVFWCAGAGVVGTPEADLERETSILQRFLSALGKQIHRGSLGAGCLFLASSAGGLYAGSSSPPFTEQSPPAPLSPYGWAKLEQETAAREWSTQHDASLVLGRISNLYGPGQDLSKNQGLITQICRRAIAHQPLILYVPLDTIRDYIFAPDAASVVVDSIDEIAAEAFRSGAAITETKIVASQQSTTVGNILAEVRRVTKRPVSVVLAHSPNAAFQVRDLRVKSMVRTDWDKRRKTPLAAGIHAIISDILSRSMGGQLSLGLAGQSA